MSRFFMVDPPVSGKENEGLSHVISALEQNKLVIFCSAPNTKDNPFSKGWHYVMFVGMENGKIITANSSTNGVFDGVEGIQFVDYDSVKKAMVKDVVFDESATWGVLPETKVGASFIVID